MATPILNQLIEEAAGRSVDLAEQAAEAAAAVEALVQRAEALKERVLAEAEEVHRRFEEVGASLEEGEGRLGTAGEAVQGGMDGVVSRAEETRGAADTMLAGIRDAASELEAVKERLVSVLEGRVEATDQELGELMEQVHRVQASLQQDLDSAASSVEAFRAAVNEAREQFAAGQERLIESTGGLAETAQEKGDACVEAMNAAGDAIREGLLAFSNRMIDAHNAAVTTLRDTFTKEAVDRLDASLEPLRAAVTTLAELCSGEEEALAARAGEIADQAQSVLRLMESLAPPLQRAAALG